jgi:aminoglycoside 3-N-acetyltransferase
MNKNYIELSLKKIGIKKNDIIFVHSDIINLPISSGIINIKKKVRFICDNIFKTLEKVVGKNGTIITPTFNYDFCKIKKFDLYKTPSKEGVFTEYFRNNKNVIRTINPIHSVAVYGFLKEKLTNNIGNNCFGVDSIFEKIYKHNAWIIFLGTTLQSCTFVHRCEELANVPYRFYKKFSGFLIIKGKKTFINHSYYCRYKNKFKNYNNGNTIHDKLEKNLLEKKILIKPYKKFDISGVRAANLQDYLVSKLKSKPFYLLKKNVQ